MADIGTTTAGGGTSPDPVKAKDLLIRSYPPKVGRKRSKAILVNDPDNIQEIQSNTRTVPGIITQRGCTYAGCKGVVLGPTRDIVNITHGPIGCGYYSWLTRRNQTKPPAADAENFMTYCFSTDMQDENIIFGGEKKLKAAIQEAYDLFHPKAIAIFSTCPVGLIGDDVHSVAKAMKEQLGINVFGFSCEGYKGVSQSAGHHIANNQLFKHIIGLDDTPSTKQFKVNVLGEYNIGGDGFEVERVFEKCGITLHATFSGNSSYGQFANAHTADLNVVTCHRSINYVADMLEKKFGIPWLKVNFVGATSTAKSLRKIAHYFQDQELIKRVEEVIAEEMVAVKAAQEKYRPRLQGKKAMLFVGGSRAHHYQDLFKEMGMNVVAAGYEFAHRDDYEGRKVLPTINVDADSRNIEELEVVPDATRYRPRLTESQVKELEAQGLSFKDYAGMMAEMDKDTLVIDDLSHYETEKLIEVYRPNIICAGIKEKYVISKSGVPCKQLHNYDMGGPYTCFQGAINFYADVDQLVNITAWKLIKAPWQKNDGIEASYGR
jgi:nitrogenase molybdenum-iron protein alpha chain